MMRSPHSTALFQALFVTFIWSLSWVLIKIGVQDIPALVFAGLRYSIAAVVLLGLVLSRPVLRRQLTQSTGGQWRRLAVLGVVLYAVTQGAQFLALVYLPAVTLSLMLNFTVVLVALSGIVIGEYPAWCQWLGIGLFIVGAVIYFDPQTMPAGIGLLIASVSVIANATAAVLGRMINRDAAVSSLIVTTVSMSIGACALLGGGLVVQGLPVLALSSWLLILWLAVVHTAFTFTLWNHTMRYMKAFESSLINNTMLIQIALLAWVFLGETVSVIGIIGLTCAAAGVLIVQLGNRR